MGHDNAFLYKNPPLSSHLGKRSPHNSSAPVQHPSPPHGRGINGALGLDTATGVQRFLGMWATDREQKAKYFYTTLAFTAAVHASAAAALFAMGLAGVPLGEFTPQMLAVAGALVALGFADTYYALMAAHLRTDIHFAAVAAGSLAKLAVGVALVKAGWGWTGAALGYALVGAAVLATGAYYAPRWTGRPALSLSALADVLKAGVASWAPGMVATLGRWLGVFAIFHAATAAETGQYYAALTIANAVLMIATSILSLLLPVLSGMADGRKRAAARALRISLAVAAPAAAFAAAYPALPLALLGHEYAQAAPALTILILSLPPTAVVATAESLAYAYGNYRQVLVISLVTDLTRVALYPVLASLGPTGVAAAYTAGAYTGMAYALHIAPTLATRQIWAAIAIPAALAAAAWATHLPWPLGLLVTATSYPIYAKAKILTRQDAREIATALLPPHLVDKTYQKLKPIIDALF